MRPGGGHLGIRPRGVLAVTAALVLAASCSASDDTSSDESASIDTEASSGDDETATSAEGDDEPFEQAPIDDTEPDDTGTDDTQPVEVSAREGVIAIDAVGAGRPIDRRLLGTNVPAWLGPSVFESEWFLDAIDDAGVTVIRMPGGSWSNAYDWAGCEVVDPDRCYWTWAARPTDFVELLDATGLPGMWTLPSNTTAEEAAAAVAFFNGSPDDDRQIGVDRTGRDWGTVGEWAELRVENGNPEPAAIRWWEIGNETYGGNTESGGTDCNDWGWEEVFTCDGTEYVKGIDGFDGYLRTREAMLAVDPTIEIGAVGVADPDSWADWGSEVLGAAGNAMDFYVVHFYAADESISVDEALDRSENWWPDIIADSRSEMPDGVELAITEYNLVSFEGGDWERQMTLVGNAFYIADTIGQLATAGVEMANHWNMANGNATSDYGLITADGVFRYPQFEAMATWGRAGNELLNASEPPDDWRVYPTRRDDGSLAIVVLHPSDETDAVVLAPTGSWATATVSLHGAESPTDGSWDTELSTDLVVTDDEIELELPPWSIALVEVTPGG